MSVYHGSGLFFTAVLSATAADSISNTPQSVTVTQMQNAHQAILSMPAESVMERFEMQTASGQQVHYVALTEGDVGALLFIDSKLYGKLSRHDAMAFYSCRGYATATQKYWEKDADAWVANLKDLALPVTEISLQFSGKSTLRSIVEVVNNPSLSQLSSLIDLGTNPLGIFRKLNSARDSYIEHENFLKNSERLQAITIGSNEEKVAKIIRPEDASFITGGVVMAYPRYSVEFFIRDGIVKVIQQPAFSFLSRTQAALFYNADMKWDLCTPQNWNNALPATTAAAP